jgi:hypothetical protein
MVVITKRNGISGCNTHPKITLGQARLTPEFFTDGLPERRYTLVV